MQKHILQFPGPLRADLSVTSGTTYPEITVKAPLGPKFQGIPEWTAESIVDLNRFESTINTRTGPKGAAIWGQGLDATGIAKADRVVGEWSLPLGAIAKWMMPGMTDTIGLSISELYPLVDPSLQSIISADGGVTRRSDAEIIALIIASPLTNIPGRTLFYDADFGAVLYANGLQPVESAERRLWKYLFDTQFEPLYVDSEVYLVDNYQIYVEV